jgi:hypothetical protein
MNDRHDQRIDTYLAAREKALAYLLAHANEDGSIGPVEHGIYYYRAPWALALGGKTADAQRLMGWIRRQMVTAEGDFRGAPSPFDEAGSTAFTYELSCLIYGAHLLRHFDLAQRSVDYLLRWQDPHTGGFSMNRHRTGPSGRQALYPTAQAGMACVITGRIDAAVATGRWFERLWALQPELPDRLYTVYAQEEGLVRDHYAPEERKLYVNEAQQAQEYHYNGGIAAAFLCQLYAATGDGTWLALARRYQSFSMGSTTRQFEVMQVCKSGWGGALLYHATGEEQYRAWAIRLGDWFVSRQHADGHWSQSAYLAPTPTTAQNLEITAEFVVHVDAIAGALAGGSRGSLDQPATR